MFIFKRLWYVQGSKLTVQIKGEEDEEEDEDDDTIPAKHGEEDAPKAKRALNRSVTTGRLKVPSKKSCARILIRRGTAQNKLFGCSFVSCNTGILVCISLISR